MSQSTLESAFHNVDPEDLICISARCGKEQYSMPVQLTAGWVGSPKRVNASCADKACQGCTPSRGIRRSGGSRVVPDADVVFRELGSGLSWSWEVKVAHYEQNVLGWVFADSGFASLYICKEVSVLRITDTEIVSVVAV
jgi:hypothetical protein